MKEFDFFKFNSNLIETMQQQSQTINSMFEPVLKVQQTFEPVFKAQQILAVNEAPFLKLAKEQEQILKKTTPLMFDKSMFSSFSHILKESASVNSLLKKHTDLKFYEYIDTSSSFVSSVNNLLNAPNIFEDEEVYSDELLSAVDEYINKTQNVTDCKVDVKHMSVIDKFKLALDIVSVVLTAVSIAVSIATNQPQDSLNNSKTTICNNNQNNVTINNFYFDITKLNKIVITEVKKLFNTDK